MFVAEAAERVVKASTVTSISAAEYLMAVTVEKAPILLSGQTAIYSLCWIFSTIVIFLEPTGAMRTVEAGRQELIKTYATKGADGAPVADPMPGRPGVVTYRI